WYRTRTETDWGPWLNVAVQGRAAIFDGVDARSAENFKLATDAPSTYPGGETVFFVNNSPGWPAVYGTVKSVRGYVGGTAVTQHFYPYNVSAPIKYRQALYGSDTWGEWESLLTSTDAKGFALSNAYVNFGDTDAPMNTDEFIALLTAMGAFTASGHWVVRGGWAYAYNRTITDSGFGHISLAGAVVEVTGNSTFFTVRILTAPQANTPEAGLNANSEFIYVSNGT
ncbi:hypothetical protein PZ740_06780, partial [Rhodospirillales bacterium YIM 152171]|nr:hypothetical protein [Marinimicrococcus flavescens]